jgi:hypothetical protein
MHPRRDRRLLRARRQRPRSRSAADKRDELAPFHSIISSAMASTPGDLALRIPGT